MFCPYCGFAVSVGSYYCTSCRSDVTALREFEPKGEDASPLLSVIRSFRQTVLWFAQYFLLFFLVYPWTRLQSEASSVWYAIWLSAVLGAVVCLLILMFHVSRLTRSLQLHDRWGWVLAMLVPFVNLITMILLVNRAKSWLKKRGVKVSFGFRMDSQPT